jgi:hypothetical protein
MILTRSYRLLPLGLLLIALPASSAAGATKKSKSPARPTITSVAPLKLGVGDMLTIRGTNFIVGKKVNSVAFKRAGSPAVFVKAAESTRTRMKVIVPASIRAHMAKKAGVPQATRFRLRILARRFSKSYTPNKLSPTIDPSVTVDDKTGVGAPAPGAGPGAAAPGAAPGSAAAAPGAPPDCDADGVVDALDADDDNDQLSDVLEVSVKTNPCVKDTDGDGMEDAWEYYSALDLNSSNTPVTVPATQLPCSNGNPSVQCVPYPGKRPYANPLDGRDSGIDHDGDGMNAVEEHAMWQRYGGRALPLSYSDGTQFTGTPVPESTNPSLNIVFDGDSQYHTLYLSDDEKDVDGDRLGNWDETHGRLNTSWWTANFKLEKPFPSIYGGLDYLDPDTDGDGVLDGNDDQDHDDYTNVQERDRFADVSFDTPPSPLMVNPYNPCLPDYNSRTCPRYIEAGTTPYAPFPLSDPPPPNPLPWP